MRVTVPGFACVKVHVAAMVRFLVWRRMCCCEVLLVIVTRQSLWQLCIATPSKQEVYYALFHGQGFVTLHTRGLMLNVQATIWMLGTLTNGSAYDLTTVCHTCLYHIRS